jgi:hypothetical protein
MFALVTAMPDRIIRWVGQLLANLGDEGRGMAQQSLGESKSGYAQMGKQSGQAREAGRENAKGTQVGQKQAQVGQNHADMQNQRADAAAAYAKNSEHEQKSIPPIDDKKILQ